MLSKAYLRGSKIYHYALLIRADKPIGTYLLLWPCLWALWIAAQGTPDFWILTVFVLGTLLMRSAGCAINDFADRHIDPYVARTAGRPLATGAISSKEALGVFVALVLAAFALVLTLNAMTIQLSLVALVLAFVYPFAKRYTYFPQVILGAAFAWAIPMAFAAITDTTPAVGWALYAITVLWTLAYDTIYAMADREDDLKIGVKSTAVLFAQHDLAIVIALEVIVFIGLLLVAQQLALGLWFYPLWTAAALYAAFLLVMIADRHPAHCLFAFLKHHHLGWLIFIGIALSY